MYEVYFCTEPWPNVSMQLLNTVRQGHRPAIPANAPEGVANLIKECWQHDRMLRPNASEVSRLIQQQLETVSSISSMPDDMDDMSSMPVSNCNSLSNVEICEGQGRYSTSSICDDTYEDLSHINGSINTDLVASESNGEAIESPKHVQIITDGMITISNTVPSFFNSNLDNAKSILHIGELREFQIRAISAVMEGKDVVVVQPTGSGKSICYTLPALLYSGKVAIIIEPVVAIITNQVDALAKKGVDTVELLVTINHTTFTECSTVHPTYHL